MNRKRILTGSILISCFILGTVFMFATPASVKVTYGLTTKTDDGITIYFNVFEPINGDKKMKAMILGHGGSATKEFLKGYAIEMAAAGFIVVTLDFRGHGQSTGAISFDKLDRDVKAVKKYLDERSDVDIHNLGYLGYSMGGWPGNRVVKEDDDFKCLILVGSGLEIEKDDISNRSLNILMIQARYDEAHPLERTKTEMGDWLGKKTKNVYVNKLYGDFERNASMIYLDDNSDHLTLAWDSDFIREARYWVVNTFPNVKAPDENFYAHFRFWILVMQVTAGLGLFFLLIKPLSRVILHQKEEEIIEIEEPNESVRSLSKKLILYSLGFGIPGMVIMSWILFTLPLSIAGLFTMLLFGQAFGILLLLRNIAKKSDSSLKEYILKSLKQPKELIFRNIVLGIILGGILYSILILTFGFNYIGWIPSIFKLPWVPIYFTIIFLIMITLGILMQLLFQTKLRDKPKGLIKTGVLGFLFQILYLYFYIILFCVVSNNYFTMIFLIIATPVTLLCSFVLAVLYKESGNIIAGAIVTTIIITCLLSTLAPFAFTLSNAAPFL